MQRVVAESRRTMLEKLILDCRVSGRLVLAGDGSRPATPRTCSNEARFTAREP